MKIKNMNKIAAGLLIMTFALSLTACSIGDAASGEQETDSGENEVITGAAEPIEYESVHITNQSNLIPADYDHDYDGDAAYFWTQGDKNSILVQFAGITCPDADTDDTIAKPWGPEAQMFTDNKLSNARKIYLEWAEADLYGNSMAWVWVDGHLLQEELIEEGLADCTNYTFLSDYSDTLFAARDNAKAAEIGIWGKW